MTTIQLLDHAQHVHASGAHHTALQHLAADDNPLSFFEKVKSFAGKVFIGFLIFLAIIFLVGFIIGFWLGRKLGKRSGRKEAERGLSDALTDND